MFLRIKHRLIRLSMRIRYRTCVSGQSQISEPETNCPAARIT